MSSKALAVHSLAVFAIVICAAIPRIASGSGQPIIITVRVNQPGAQISPSMGYHKHSIDSTGHHSGRQSC